MAISTLGDLISQIQLRSQGSVVYSVQASTIVPGGYDVLRNGAKTWSFLFKATPAGPDLTGAKTDASNGALVELWAADGTTMKADAVGFINSLS